METGLKFKISSGLSQKDSIFKFPFIPHEFKIFPK